MKILDFFRRKSAELAKEMVPAPPPPQPAAYSPYSGYRTVDGSKYSGEFFGSGSAIQFDHHRLRRNTRAAEYDVPQLKTLIDRFADLVVDVGIKFQSTPEFMMLGITREAAEEWGSRIDAAFDAWCRSKKSDRTETNNFYQNQRMYARWMHRDNDIFVRFYYSDRKDLLNPLQIGFIDPDQIRGDAFTSTGTQFEQDDGIIRNASGVETHYKVWSTINGQIRSETIPAYGPKSGKRMMLHGFNPEYAGQGRGFARFAHALSSFQKFMDFDLAHIHKAIAQASWAAYVEPSLDKPASQPLAGGMTTRGAAPYGATYGSDPQPDPEAESGDYEYTPVPEFANRAPGSAVIGTLKAGEKLQQIQNTAPITNYDIFEEVFVGSLAASLGMPYSLMKIRFGESFSAQRGEMMVFWRIGKIWINEMVSDFLDPVFETWLSEEIAAGRVTAPGWSDPRLRAAWLSGRWNGAPMPNIDPAKTAKADWDYVEMGAQTLDDVALNLNGSSHKSNSAKLAREFSELPESPFKPAGPGA